MLKYLMILLTVLIISCDDNNDINYEYELTIDYVGNCPDITVILNDKEIGTQKVNTKSLYPAVYGMNQVYIYVGNSPIDYFEFIIDENAKVYYHKVDCNG